MKTHDDAQLGMLDVLGDHAVNRAPGLHTRQIRHGFDNITERLKRHHAQLDKAQLETFFRGLHQIFEALDVVRIQTLNLIEHGLIVVAVVKVRAIVKADSVERRHQTQVNMVFHVATA